MSYDVNVSLSVTANNSSTNSIVISESATASLSLSNYVKVDIPLASSAPGTTAIKALQDLTQKEFIVIIPAADIQVCLWASPGYGADVFIQVPANFPFIMQTNTSATFTDLYIKNPAAQATTVRVIAGDRV